MNGVMPLWGNRAQEAFFRRSFELSVRPEKAFLRIYVDTGYELFLNGRFVAEVDEWNNTRDYDVTLFLKPGSNLIAVHGVNHAGHRGLSLELVADDRQCVCSDRSWKCADFEHWGWMLSEYDDAKWEQAHELPLQCAGMPQWNTVPGDGSFAVIPTLKCSPFFRGSVPKCVDSPLYGAEVPVFEPAADVVSVAGEGYLRNLQDTPPSLIQPVTFTKLGEAGEWAQRRFTVVKTERYTGPALLLDFGQEVVGYFRMRLKSDAPICFRLHYGETIAEALSEPPRNQLQNRMLTEEYTLFQGIQEFESRARVGGRFVRVEFFDCAAAVVADEFGLRTECYPVAYRGYFHCSDEELNSIWRAGRKTLHLCMQEYYLDAVKRDRMLWTGDTRAEALFNYYLFGDTALFRFCWDEIASCRYADGSIPSAMGTGSSLLWDYVAWWIVAFYDYYMHTADADFLRKHAANICDATDFLISKCNADHLFEVPENPYHSWMVVLTNQSGISPFMNEIFLRSVETAVEVCALCGDGEKQSRYEALLTQCRPAVEALLKRSPVYEETKLLGHSTGRYEMVEMLFRAGFSERALAFLRKSWGIMLRETHSDTLFEGFLPDRETGYPSQENPDDKACYISFCHGWTAGPNALLPREVAGIKPLEPGFRRFEVRPCLCDLNSLECVVPTPFGEIALALQMDNGTLTGVLAVPPGTVAELCLPDRVQMCKEGITRFPVC